MSDIGRTLVIAESGKVYMLCEDAVDDLIVDLGSGLRALVNLITGYAVTEWRPGTNP